MKNRKIVKASAGTGKTYRLALEYISRILLGEKYSEVLFITFTRKATAEVKIRISEFLDDLSCGNKELEENIKRLYPEVVINKDKIRTIKKELLSNKDKIRIYTIDSFIGQIFKKAIGPYLNIYSYGSINSKEEEETYRKVFSEIINSRDFEKIKTFLEKTADRDVDKYIDMIRKLSQDRWKFKLLKEKEDPKVSVEYLEDRLYRMVIEIFECANTLVEEHGKSEDKVYAKTGKLIRGITKKDELIPKILENRKTFFSSKILNGNQMRSATYIKEQVNELQDEIIKIIKEIFFIREVVEYEKDILKVEALVRRVYEKLKFKEKKFSFSDITNYTSEYLDNQELDLIKDGKVTENFYEIIGGKISTLFLDEAQDTSVSQWKIIEPIAKGCDNVIIVGDEKQSIYSWRGGDKGLFLTFEKILDASVETLPTNYRSEKKIIDFVNTFFDSVSKNYSEEVANGIWDYQPVKCSKKDDKGMVGVIVDVDIHEKLAIDIKERHTFDENPNYKGVGVVARRAKDLNLIAEELKKLEIPFILENSLSITYHPCVVEIMRLFRFFLHDDYKVLLEFFRTTLEVGEEKLKYLLKNKEVISKYMKNFDEDILENIINEDIKIELDRIKRIKNTPFEKLGVSVVKEYNFIEKYSVSRDIKNINFFLELMGNYNELWEFIEFLDANEGSEDLGQIGINEINSVILMTVHKSKGLDFHTEYVFLRDKKETFKLTGNRDGMTIHQLQLLTKMDENYEKVEDFIFTNSKYKKEIEDTEIYKHNERIFLDEVMNIQYVALTRPKANLILCIEPTKTTKNKEEIVVLRNDLLISPIEKYFNISREELLEVGSKEIGEFIKYEKEEEAEEFNFALDKQIYINSNLDKNVKNRKLNSEKIESSVEKEIKRKEGLAIHYYLENIKYGREKEKETAKKLMLNKYSNMLGIEKTKKIIEKVEKFISNNPEVFNERWNVFNELELVTYEKEIIDGKEKTIKKVHIIDRLNLDEKNKEIIIYDYKSGISMYQEQLDRYKRVIKEKIGESYTIKTEFLKLN